MSLLHKTFKMTPTGEKIRFLACEQIELTLKGTFANGTKVLPFGSSVNSFGKRNSDLDMILLQQRDKSHQNSSSRLVFHTKGTRSNNMYLMTYVSYAIRHMLPGKFFKYDLVIFITLGK